MVGISRCYSDYMLAYTRAFEFLNSNDIEISDMEECFNDCLDIKKTISENCHSNKGVRTPLTPLLVRKLFLDFIYEHQIILDNIFTKLDTNNEY